MNKGIRVRLATAKTFRLIIAVILSVLAGQTFQADAQTETNLYSFIGPPTDGANPYAGLVQGSDGNFYGTTEYAGSTNCLYGCGTVFRINPGGSYTNLYSFVGSPTDGAYPGAGLMQGSDGNFYGTTFVGGTNNLGIVFRISPGGSYTTLYSFVGSPTDGAYPGAGLVQGSDGNFYGTTFDGGTNNLGIVFRISPGGSYTNLYSFAGSPTDGANPYAGLAQGSDGNFYGTTEHGGTGTNCYAGCGTVFRISPSGSYTTLYSFAGSPGDGAYPRAGLVQGSDGNFYGTTVSGGANNFGTVFRINPGGSYTNLCSFAGPPGDGAYPGAGLVQGSDGNFYGTTFNGGTNNLGIVFQISLGGSYTNLCSFAGPPGDGAVPGAGLVQGSDGNFYGTTSYGGIGGSGTVFRLSVPLSPPPYPINQITGFQLSVTNVVFNIPSIAGETYQLQFTTDLTSGLWSNLPGVSVTNSIGSVLTLTNFGGASQSQGFYRFLITP
ncbi:MAG: choice-of-anchor tandem repeat GloVer-containing protein [Verrucomicrobiia bacterium]